MTTQQKQDEIANLIEHSDIVADNGRKPIIDGVINCNLYDVAPIKIMWILKEPVDTDGDNCWDLAQMLNEETGEGLNGRTSWRRISYASYSLLTGKTWGNAPYIYDNDEVPNALKSTAWVNISKTAGDSHSNQSLEGRSKLWRPILERQIEAFCPDVIVLCGTFDYLKEDLQLTDGCNVSKGFARGFKKESRYILSAYHPQATNSPYGPITDEIYADTLLETYTALTKM